MPGIPFKDLTDDQKKAAEWFMQAGYHLHQLQAAHEFFNKGNI